MALKKPVKIGLLVAGVASVFLLAKCAMDHGVIPTPSALKAMVPEKTDARLVGDVVAGAPAQTYDLVAAPGAAPQGTVRVLSIPWNGMSSLAVANGGPRTGGNSLVKKYTGGNVLIERQDDYSVMREEMLKFAKAQANGDQNPDGAAFVIIMGDGLPAFMSALKPHMDELHQKVAVLGVLGYSYGEDKCMGRPLDGDPQKAKGSLIAAVPYDGDWNICVKWAADNGLKINTDQSSYDPDAINFTDTTSFVQADEKFIAGACENRTVVHDGLKTKETKRVCVDGVATWTPGDEAVVSQKGGLVTWASTHDYNQQMPAVLIGNVEWAKKHQDFVVGLLKAADRGSYVIRTQSDGLDQLGRAQAAIFGQGGGAEARPDFWSKAYAGYDVNDGQGNKVRIGGSRAATLAEVRDFLGLGSGSYNVYKGVYNVFGKYATTFYPKDVPSVPKYEDVVDTSFVQAALQGVTITGAAKPQYTEGSIKRAVSSKSYSIEFDSGKATIKGASLDTLFDIANQSGMTGLKIRISGHTDNTGNAATNTALSRARAQAVADWLYQQAPSTFPRERMEVRGYGDSQPVGDNATDEGRAKNRRVEIVLGE